MNIQVNGEEREIEDGLTVTELLEGMALGGLRVAVAVNREVVPRALHSRHELRPGDRVEIVQAVQGG